LKDNGLEKSFSIIEKRPRPVKPKAAIIQNDVNQRKAAAGADALKRSAGDQNLHVLRHQGVERPQKQGEQGGRDDQDPASRADGYNLGG
jgi:hypothetical protein